MINLIEIETVNFYGDNLDIALTDENIAYASVSQIIGYLGLELDLIVNMFDNDPRVGMDVFEDQYIVPLSKLNGFLMLLPYNEVPEDLKDDLMRYQVECFEVLHDYWIHGVALNRREIPFNITSKFKDEREVSRKALTTACALYCEGTDTDPGELFDKVLANSYDVIGLKPLHEDEKLTGAEAKYLAWVESVFAKAIGKFAAWNEAPEDVIQEAREHVEYHLRETGSAWLAMADAMPSSCYNR